MINIHITIHNTTKKSVLSGRSQRSTKGFYYQNDFEKERLELRQQHGGDVYGASIYGKINSINRNVSDMCSGW